MWNTKKDTEMSKIAIRQSLKLQLLTWALRTSCIIMPEGVAHIIVRMRTSVLVLARLREKLCLCWKLVEWCLKELMASSVIYVLEDYLSAIRLVQSDKNNLYWAVCVCTSMLPWECQGLNLIFIYYRCAVPMMERRRSDVTDGVSWWCPHCKSRKSIRGRQLLYQV